ncbi:uncharacterized protein PHACADRAFT_247740 [Phanerochaete carnosa HHB-10118-sp]|uniref:Tethering factor for nuclear proteasome STS1 n=1 Tax=Phanerochaete carnosa (strain HHB-10118-sp) TaxID=650164 RepID=K5XDY6_PHACS|nr:uncharacterized protein PHACADRAFT_247740 [Phanerochaete carnosa HHB-10118-sp]EKM61252.1 hypothetical protein PHACADRAFT_247740 [Phanerochaete carnosa HHB-10118-sp]
MAHVLAQPPHQVTFPHRPVNHAPSPLGFGFGLSAQPGTSTWNHTPLQRSVSGFPAISSHSSQNRVAKRRYDHDEDDRQSADESMERSPTPERPKRAAPKRARTTPAVVTSLKDVRGGQQGSSGSDGIDVDVGVLLGTCDSFFWDQATEDDWHAASLPRETLLPVLTSLITANPSLKASVLSLIPRPTLETATQAIDKSARKLLDAFPYSNTSFGVPNPPFSGGMTAFSSARSLTFGGFGAARPPSFDQAPDSPQSSGMREEYILSRLRSHVQDFVSACFSYLPYFSYSESTSLAETGAAHPAPHARSHASALQSQHKDKSHPSETFLFLQSLMNHILSQPPLTQFALLPLLLPRLLLEWKAWIDRVDHVVNREGGMFGQETVRSWERGLDDLAQAKGNGVEAMRAVRDQWVSRVGWLVGRQQMEEH